VPGEGGRDPTKKVIGIVTLEDIIEDIIQDEIEDEWDVYGDEKNQRKAMKEKLVLLFTDHEAEKVLNE
jgi:metal transporter CNNM